MNLELEKAVLRGMEDLDHWSPPHLRAKAVIDSIVESGFGIVDSKGRFVRPDHKTLQQDEQMGEDE